MENIAKTQNAGTITVSSDDSGIKLYPHQIEAFDKMTKQIENTGKYPYKGLLVLPTGGGKTLTAARWIAENILDKGTKVLWLAHRHELLEQAKRTFAEKLAYKDVFKRKNQFKYRLVSGIHDMAVNIKPDDDIIFSSKDSLRSEKSFGLLRKRWLNGNDEVFLVIDEAHHAPAKTYRKLIEQLEKSVSKFRMLGLTATPIRTAKKEVGYMAKIFPDDMVYKIDLRSLIRQGILSEPVFEEVETGIDLRKDLSDEQIKKINDGFELDNIGADVAKKIADNSERNNLIVNRYINNKEKYGKTIIFSVNKENVIALNKLFNEKGVRSDFVMSDTRDASGLHNISSKENKDKIKRFRKGGDLDVLINVNILTEGTDVPDVQSVFLTRPTQSTILMTQMMGRALRGEKAGGTKDAFIVTFIDQWSDKIAWVNPEKLYIDGLDFSDFDPSTRQRITRLIAISKIEEFAVLSDRIIDPDKKKLIESVDFIKRIPKGVYKFSYPYHDGDGDPIDKVCEVLVYDNLEDAYNSLVEDIPQKFGHFREDLDDVDDIDIANLSDTCEIEYFSDVEHYPAYRLEDIDDLIRYYLITGETPNYYEFTERGKYDITAIAQYILDNDFGQKAESEYIKNRWESDQDAWSTFSDFTEKMYRREIMLAKERILHPEDYSYKAEKPKEIFEDRLYEDMTMAQIREENPAYEKWLRDRVFEKYTDKNGYYFSAQSGFKSKNRWDFEIDHILPFSAGGKTKIDNLQLLKVWENRKKGNTIDDTETDDITDDQNDIISNDSEDTEAMASGKSMLRITLPNGNIIFEKNPTETYVKAVEQAGIDKVKGLNIRRCGIQLIRKNKDWQYTQKRLSDGQYLFSNLSTKDKKRLLEQINEALKLGWRIEIIGESKGEFIENTNLRTTEKGEPDHNQGHFSMVVDNIFFLSNMGTMLTGEIALGTIHAGDEVILDNGTRAYVDRIELINHIVNKATKGDYIGLHIGFVDKSRLSKGMTVEDYAHHDNTPFEMHVAEIHSETKQGVELKGDIIKGGIKVGDPVKFFDGESLKFSSAVSSINMQGRTVDSAEEGQSVVLYFNAVAKKKMEETIWTIRR